MSANPLRGRGTPDRETLLRAARELLSRLGYTDSRVVVTVSTADGSTRLRFSGKPGAAGPRGEEVVVVPERPEGAPQGWRWLSPLEEAIVRAVPPDDWASADQIARATGESLDGDLRTILRNLVNRGVLRVAQGRGYRLRKGDEEE